MQEPQLWSLGWKDPLEKEMETHYSILAWEIPRTEEPCRLYSSWGCKRIGNNLATKQQIWSTGQKYQRISESELITKVIYLKSSYPPSITTTIPLRNVHHPRLEMCQLQRTWPHWNQSMPFASQPAAAKSLQSCLILCDPIPGILQAITL